MFRFEGRGEGRGGIMHVIGLRPREWQDLLDIN